MLLKFTPLMHISYLFRAYEHIVGGEEGTSSCWSMCYRSFSPNGLLPKAGGVNWILWGAKFSNCWAL